MPPEKQTEPTRKQRRMQTDGGVYIFTENLRRDRRGSNPLSHRDENETYTPLSTGNSYEGGRHEQPCPQRRDPTSSHSSALS